MLATQQAGTTPAGRRYNLISSNSSQKKNKVVVRLHIRPTKYLKRLHSNVMNITYIYVLAITRNSE